MHDLWLPAFENFLPDYEVLRIQGCVSALPHMRLHSLGTGSFLPLQGTVQVFSLSLLLPAKWVSKFLTNIISQKTIKINLG